MMVLQGEEESGLRHSELLHLSATALVCVIGAVPKLARPLIDVVEIFGVLIELEGNLW